jgi:hypothetical protein
MNSAAPATSWSLLHRDLNMSPCEVDFGVTDARTMELVFAPLTHRIDFGHETPHPDGSMLYGWLARREDSSSRVEFSKHMISPASSLELSLAEAAEYLQDEIIGLLLSEWPSHCGLIGHPAVSDGRAVWAFPDGTTIDIGQMSR